MFEGSFKEATTGEITIEDVTADAMQMLTYWLYTGKRPSGRDAWMWQPNADESGMWRLAYDRSGYAIDSEVFSLQVSNPTQALIKFYVLADRFLLDRTVQAKILEEIAENHSIWLHWGQTGALLWNHVSESLPERDPLRLLVSDLLCSKFLQDGEILKDPNSDTGILDPPGFLEGLSEYVQFVQDPWRHTKGWRNFCWDKSWQGRYKLGCLAGVDLEFRNCRNGDSEISGDYRIILMIQATYAMTGRC